MAQKYDLDKLMVEAAKQNEDFKKGVKLASISNDKEAVIYFEKAARTGIPIAMFYAGYNYEQLNDFNKAVEWYTKGAQKGEAESQLCLAYCYEKGDGVKKDLQKAVFWYTKAAEQGEAMAQTDIAEFYRTGYGVKEDLQKAFYWYSKAAVNGNTEAQFYLGYFYAEGMAVTKDMKKARYWMQKAADLGDEEAKEWLEEHK